MPAFRVYAELNDFLPPALRGRAFEGSVAPHESLKHAIEALGVPHTEVALVLVDGEPASLGQRIAGAGRIDAELAAQARAERRIVLTRDRDLLMHRDVERGCYLRDTEPAAQLAELAQRLGLGLRDRPPAGRCLACNTPLQPVGKADVEERLPEGTRRAFEHFWRCPACGGVFWCGSHWKRMRATLEAAAHGGAGAPGRVEH